MPSGTVPFTFVEAMALGSGWVFVFLLGILILAIFKFTPALIFLKAKFKKSYIFGAMYPHGVLEFCLGKSSDAGSAELSRFGPVKMTEGSHMLEMKTKVPLFLFFTDFAYSLKREYPAIIQELRAKGYPINNHSDYRELIKLATDASYQAELLNNIQDPEKREFMRQKIEQLKTEKIELQPYKTYNLFEMATMFPNNVRPDFVRAKMINAVTRMQKQLGTQKQLLITAAIAIFVICIGAVFLFKFAKCPDCGSMPDVHCVYDAGVMAAKTAVQNVTMG